MNNEAVKKIPLFGICLVMELISFILFSPFNGSTETKLTIFNTFFSLYRSTLPVSDNLLKNETKYLFKKNITFSYLTNINENSYKSVRNLTVH